MDGCMAEKLCDAVLEELARDPPSLVPGKSRHGVRSLEILHYKTPQVGDQGKFWVLFVIV